MNEKLYIGSDEVFGITKEEFTTPKGSEVVRVNFKNGRTEVMPKLAFEKLATATVSDATDLRDRKFRIVIPQVIELLAEYDFSSKDTGSLFMRCIDSLEENFDRALNMKWTGNDKAWVPGAQSRERFTILECNEVLKTIKKDEPATGETTTNQ